jgi:hypothetical protein
MKRLLPFVLSLLLGTLALAAPTFSETQACSANVCSRSAPTSSAEGLSLYYVNAYRLTVCAASSQTLGGAGTMLAYFCDATNSVCMRAPDLDQSVSVSGSQCQSFPDFWVPAVNFATRDSVVFAASGVTVSGGATITVRLMPYQANPR